MRQIATLHVVDISVSTLYSGCNMTSRNIAEHVGKRIKKVRESQKLSQEKLGELADISRTHVERIERGISSPPMFTLYRIAKALKINSSDILPF